MASPVILLNLWSLDLRAQPLEIKGDGEKRGRKGRKRKEGGRGGAGRSTSQAAWKSEADPLELVKLICPPNEGSLIGSKKIYSSINCGCHTCLRSLQ